MKKIIYALLAILFVILIYGVVQYVLPPVTELEYKTYQDEGQDQEKDQKQDQTITEKNDLSSVKNDQLTFKGDPLSVDFNEKGDVISIGVETTSCADTTGTPIIVGDYLVYSLHDSEDAECVGQSPYSKSLLGLNLTTNNLYELAELDRSESTHLFVPEKNLLFTTVVNRGAYYLLDSNTFEILKEGRGIKAVSDSSASYLDGAFYFGTVNNPIPLCQDPLQKDCGSLFSVDTDGDLLASLNVNEGLRGWISGAPTTDGRSLFFGTGSQNKGYNDEEFLYGCNVIKINSDLDILANADPDVPGCNSVGNVEAAVVGEPSLTNDRVWTQMLGPGDDREQVAVIQYDYDLNEICRAEFQGTSLWGSANFYQAPTIDKDGNAYVTYILPDSGGKKGFLYKISPRCQTTLLAKTKSKSLQSPTLADDKYVLFVADNTLLIYTMDGVLYKSYELNSEANVKAAPVIENGIIYILQVDGTLNIIQNSGLEGYGDAYWPRYRHDNNGSAQLDK